MIIFNKFTNLFNHRHHTGSGNFITPIRSPMYTWYAFHPSKSLFSWPQYWFLLLKNKSIHFKNLKRLVFYVTIDIPPSLYWKSLTYVLFLSYLFTSWKWLRHISQGTAWFKDLGTDIFFGWWPPKEEKLEMRKN